MFAGYSTDTIVLGNFKVNVKFVDLQITALPSI